MNLKETINIIKECFCLLYRIPKKLIKEARCKHEYEFGYNIYGDPIIFEYGFNRSAWFCKKCGKYQGRPYLVKEDGE